MLILNKIHRIAINLISVLLLAGCATAGKNTLPKEDGLTMAEIYHRQVSLGVQDDKFDNQRQNNLSQIRDKFQNQPNSKSQYSKSLTEQLQSINQSFKVLPNPEIAMVVYPHLVTQQQASYPVPGYVTAFFLYRRNYFALPSEVY